jgi:CheY-like chemotaxis protein
LIERGLSEISFGAWALEENPRFGKRACFGRAAKKERGRKRGGRRMGKEAQRCYTILVIDDDDGVRTLLRDILVFGGHHVIEAPDGILGMKYLEEGQFDMVLTDLGMPVMNGWEVARWVKKKTPQVPVGLITGWEINQEEDKIKESGVDLIIGKPFEVNEILEAVNQFIDTH